MTKIHQDQKIEENVKYQIDFIKNLYGEKRIHIIGSYKNIKKYIIKNTGTINEKKLKYCYRNRIPYKTDQGSFSVFENKVISGISLKLNTKNLKIK